MTALTLYGKADCHLCEVAKEIVETVVADLPEGAVDVTEVDILTDPQLMEQYGEKIPVVLIDGNLHAFWRVDSSRLRSALTAASAV
ncbi:glutaredoxin family protein [Amnibacterium flavum]|uniref:Thioredoxin family protein n=1 Tax=Amnibacterium flavum TaxID=2173173 RepID=A0A2V1HTC8_9MICO|nr:glutaredoxin family protein [Amnibacterium flavum]PVZ95591.1 thioredoxin family protein [Amnibacterium flavum]